MKQTAVEWLVEKLQQNKFITKSQIYIAEKMEKQQMQDFGAKCCLMTKQKNEWTLEQLYNETYGSKGSDDVNSLTSNPVDYQNHSNMSDNFKQFSLYEHKETIATANTPTSSQTEISDEEIEKAADKYVSEDEFNRLLECFEQGAKWYREQLKQQRL